MINSKSVPNLPSLSLDNFKKKKKKERRIADKLDNPREDFPFLFRPITRNSVHKSDLPAIARYRGGNLYKGRKGEGREKISGRYDTSFYSPHTPSLFLFHPLISIQISSSLPLEIGGYLDSHFPLYPLYRRFTVSVGKYWIGKGEGREDWSHFLDIFAREIAREWIQDERRKGNSAMIYKPGRKVWGYSEIDDKGQSFLRIDKETQG